MLGPSLSLSYAEPLTIVRGRGQFLFDDRGRRYLDGVNNVCHVGHANPAVAAAGAEQSFTLNTNTRYLHPEILRYARRLLATLPEHLDRVYVVNSGSEANELAIRIARTHTNRELELECKRARHGTDHDEKTVTSRRRPLSSAASGCSIRLLTMRGSM